MPWNAKSLGTQPPQIGEAGALGTEFCWVLLQGVWWSRAKVIIGAEVASLIPTNLAWKWIGCHGSCR